MKRIYIICSFFLPVLFTNCKKQEMLTYDSGHYVQFTTPAEDTISVSFFLYPGQPELSISLPVRLVGQMTKGDLSYQVKIDTATTAPAINYSIPGSFVFGTGRAIDTARVVVKNSPELLTRSHLVVLDIVSGGNVSAGQATHTRKVFKISDMISRPIWWDDDMENWLIGPYTNKKFRKFIEATGTGDMIGFNGDKKREYVLRFKYFLTRLKDAGTPVLEDDGTDMLSTIVVRG